MSSVLVTTVEDRHLAERDRELRQIDRALEVAAGGAGAVLFVEGPEGIGRTALLEHAVRAGRALGLDALAVGAAALEADHAFGVARLIFESHIDRDRALAPTWRSVRRIGRGDEQAVFDELLDRTLGLARRRPLMIAIDDAQWADPPSLRWLAYLCRRVEGAGVLVAVADRTSEVPREKRALDALRRAAGANVLRPRALSRIGVGAVVRARLGWTPGADALEACHEMTRGDPRLLRELLAAIGPESSAGVLSARSVLAAAPPSTRRAIADRLSRLTPAARALAGAAAVLGDGAELRHARVLARLGPAPASAAADELGRAAVLRRGRRLSFAAPMLARAILEGLGGAERALLEQRAARAIQSGGEDPERAAAHLHRAARDAEPWVVELLAEAATRAYARGALDEAARHLRRALAEPPSERRRAELLLALGTIELVLQDPRCVADLQAAVRSLRGREQQATAAVALSRALLCAGRVEEAATALASAREHGAEDGELALEIDAVVVSLLHSRDLTAARLSRPLEQLAAELPGHTPGERTLLGHLAYERALANHPRDEAVGLAERALVGGRLDITLADPLGSMLPAAVLMLADELDRSERLLSSAVESGHAQDRHAHAIFAEITRAHVALRRGDLALAAASCARARSAARSDGMALLAPLVLAAEVQIALEREAIADARAALTAAFAGGSPSESAIGGFVRHARGAVAMADRRYRCAIEAFLAAGADFEAAGRVTPALLAWRSDAARAYVQLGSIGPAGRLAHRELSLARSFGAPRAIGVALRGLAAVDQRRRVPLLREAVDLLAGSPARLEHAYALSDLGGAWRRAGRRAAARGCLLDALELAHECGSQRLISLARDELAALGTRPRRAARHGPQALTASEARVAKLAAQQLSNDEIARALWVSRKTIETHLSHAYAKLGIHSRRELAAALAADGALDARASVAVPR